VASPLGGLRASADQIVLRRPDLAGLPPTVVPDGYALRRFLPGDEAAWADLLGRAFPETPDARTLPAREFMAGPLWDPQRIVFACADGRPVACAAAWENAAQWGPRTGMIHWVATDPDHVRRGLGRATVVAALEWMRGRYDDAVLVTQVYRLPAIRLYLALGFRPHLDAIPEMPERWKRVERGLRG